MMHRYPQPVDIDRRKPAMTTNRIGRNIAGARVTLGWEQAELAEAVNNQTDVLMSRRTLGRIERGEREARASEVAAFADVLGVPVAWFYDGPDWLESANALGGYLASVA
jgi:transcriptional regulator with XRE-family HTH domain